LSGTADAAQQSELRRREALRRRLASGAERLRAEPAAPQPVTARSAEAVARPMCGRLQLPYFAAPVEIVTDRAGVPHVTASTRADLYRAQGFLHATERGWQIDVTARTALGKLAELLGPAAAPSDLLAHRLGMPEAVDGAVEAASPETRQVLEWYAEGQRAAALVVPTSAEHIALGADPEPPEGPAALRRAVAVFVLIASGLQHDWVHLLLRAAVEGRQLPDGAPAPAELLGALERRLGPLLPGGGAGSNAWAIAPDRSTTGGAVVAGDPHLDQREPGHWFAIHLTCPDVNVIGASIPGVPDVAFGHNGHVAWATTFAPVVSSRLVVERFAGPALVARPDGTEKVRTVWGEIAVAGGGLVAAERATTSNGALLGLDLTGADGQRYDLAVSFAAWRQPYSQPVLAAANAARAGAELAAALTGWQGIPQSVVYADRAGEIGVVQTGVRVAADASQPACGWVDARPAEVRSRHRVRIGREVVVSANDAPQGELAREPGHWEAPLRASRITAELRDGPVTPLAQSVRIQLDVLSPLAVELLGELTAGIAGEVDGEDAEVLAALRRWHGNAYRDLFEPTVFAAWIARLAAAAVPADVGRVFVASKAWLTEWGLAAVRVWVAERLRAPGGAPELAETYRSALRGLRSRLGPDTAAWIWGRAHAVRFAHALSGAPRWTQDDRVVALPGLDDSVCRGDGRDRPRGGPTFRIVVDLAEPDRSVWSWPLGNSGVPASPWCFDAVDTWAQGRYQLMPFSRAAVTAAAAGLLNVVPAGDRGPDGGDPAMRLASPAPLPLPAPDPT
jgi:penicillin G amidase